MANLLKITPKCTSYKEGKLEQRLKLKSSNITITATPATTAAEKFE
jgi:hypothetical protein